MHYYPEDQSEENLKKLYLEDELSISKIASLLDTNYSAIRNALLAAGITIRTKSQATMGRLNSRWGGDNIDPNNGRCRALRMYPPQPCHICGKVAERHHKDGDTLNNEPSNIEWLCRKHHMEADGRMDRRENGQFRSKESALLSR